MKRYGWLFGGLLLAVLGMSCTSESSERDAGGGAERERVDLTSVFSFDEYEEDPGDDLPLVIREEESMVRSFNRGSRLADLPPGFSDGKKKDAGSKKPVTTWKRSKIVPNASKLSIGDDAELPLKGLQVNVRIDGFRARVVLDLYYYNDTDRQLEGTFTVRLPNEASPHFLAFGPTVLQSADVDPKSLLSAGQAQRQGTEPDSLLEARALSWTAPKVARIVPREKAAHAYRQTVRRRVDPALMEWSGAGRPRSPRGSTARSRPDSNCPLASADCLRHTGPMAINVRCECGFLIALA